MARSHHRRIAMRYVTKADFIKLARECARDEGGKLPPAMESLLRQGYDYPKLLNKKRKIELSKSLRTVDIETYLRAFVHGYLKARAKQALFSEPKTTPDSALDLLMERFGNVAHSSLRKASRLHRLSMAAENMLGHLLEAYLAGILESRGWLWCCGNIVRAVDFYKPGIPIQLLQVKNRSNSENAASAAIRGFIRDRIPVAITKWHRIRAKGGRTCWEELPGNEGKQIADERRFLEFIRGYADGRS
jgi:hypothetical protein